VTSNRLTLDTGFQPGASTLNDAPNSLRFMLKQATASPFDKLMTDAGAESFTPDTPGSPAAAP
jgi:hypothetical protein